MPAFHLSPFYKELWVASRAHAKIVTGRLVLSPFCKELSVASSRIFKRKAPGISMVSFLQGAFGYFEATL
jgi:hypothetical protein